MKLKIDEDEITFKSNTYCDHYLIEAPIIILKFIMIEVPWLSGVNYNMALNQC